jgi:hypothetical protein
MVPLRPAGQTGCDSRARAGVHDGQAAARGGHREAGRERPGKLCQRAEHGVRPGRWRVGRDPEDSLGTGLAGEPGHHPRVRRRVDRVHDDRRGSTRPGRPDEAYYGVDLLAVETATAVTDHACAVSGICTASGPSAVGRMRSP